MILKPKYVQKPIGSIRSLASVVGISESELLLLANNSDSLFIEASRITKSDGSIRITYKAKPQLRVVLDTIKKRIFDSVIQPTYVSAGQSGKSYIDNAKTHSNSKMLLSEDIRNFFPSISVKEVRRVFQHFFCFSPDVAITLSKLCTKDGKLVQGSPLSGEIANLVFFQDEPKFAEYCKENGLRYTRYYDDIHISSDSKLFHNLIPILKPELYAMFGKVGVQPHRSAKKSHFRANNERLTVHDVTVNSHKLSPSKGRVSKVRQLLHIYEKSIESGSEIEKIISLYRSIFGHIITLKQQGHPINDKI